MKGVGHFRSFLILCLFVPLFIPSISGQAFRLSPPAPIEAYSFKIIGGVSGTFGHRDGMGTNALFGSTTGMVVDRAGNLFIADAQLGGQTIRKMTPDGVVTTIAGKSGDAAELDGIGTDARFHSPHSITADKDGNFYVADFSGSTIRKIDSEGVVTTLAGSPLMQGSEDGTASEARFRGPRGIAIDAAGESLRGRPC